MAASREQSARPDGAGPAAADLEGHYQDHYFETYGFLGEGYDHPNFKAFHNSLAARIVDDLHPSSVLDAGCAYGRVVLALRERGVEAFGIDFSTYAIAHVPEAVRTYCWQASVTEPLDRTYDLVLCAEVIEHLSAHDGELAIANLCSVTDRVLFSSTPFHYDDPTHVNVKPPEDWSALFAQNGFLRVVDYEPSYLASWAALYERSSKPLTEVVRSYDRWYWRVSNEAQQLRALVLQQSQQLADGGDGQAKELRAELRRAEAIAHDAEERLETATARAETAEAETARLTRGNQLLSSRTGRWFLRYHDLRTRFRRATTS